MADTILFDNFYTMPNIQFESLNISNNFVLNGNYAMYIDFLTQYQISNSGIVSISPYDKGIHVSDNTILQLRPERDVGPNKVDGKYVPLTFTLPIDDQNIYFNSDSNVSVNNIYGSVSSDFSPLSFNPKTKITIPQSTHYFDSYITYSAAGLSSYPYHFYGGVNNSPTLSFGINNKTSVVDRTISIPMNILDFDGDQVNWTLYNNDSFVVSGISNNTTEYYNFTPSTSGLNVFKIVASDTFGFTTSSVNLYIDVIYDNVPSGFFLTPSHTTFPYRKEYVEFNLKDLDFDIISFDLYCNGDLAVSGTTTKELNIKYPIRLPKGTYHFTLVLRDIFVDSDVINGPIIKVIDQINVSNY